MTNDTLAKASSPSALRNRGPIAEVLRSRLPHSGTVLEVASGTGEHAVYNASTFPGLRWQPSDLDAAALASVEAWRAEAALPNLLPPIRIDATAPADWPIVQADAVISINMIHISPWAATEGLMAGAARVLPTGGILFLYGPYIVDGVETAPSNLAFGLDLKRRNQEWGLRSLSDVVDAAKRYGLAFSERVVMPANNLMVMFRQT